MIDDYSTGWGGYGTTIVGYESLQVVTVEAALRQRGAQVGKAQDPRTIRAPSCNSIHAILSKTQDPRTLTQFCSVSSGDLGGGRLA